MRFVVDAQLPPALVKFLEARGHVAEHVCMRFPPGTSDETIWQYAASIDAIIVSKDEDFSVFVSIRPTGPSYGQEKLTLHLKRSMRTRLRAEVFRVGNSLPTRMMMTAAWAR